MSTVTKPFAIIVSKFNEEITTGLLQGAKSYLAEKKITIANESIFFAPGAFEIPLIAKKLAQSKKYSGIICLGCVIKGDTAHFEFISLGATVGIMMASLATETPITFGILTTYNDAQAIVRSKNDEEHGPENKGREAAAACYESAALLQKIL